MSTEPPEEFKTAFKQWIDRIAPVPAAEWQALAPLLSLRKLKKGEKLAVMGESCREIGFILKGLFKGYYLTADGAVFIRHFVAEGSLVGPYSSILRGEPSSATLEALEDSSLVVLSYDQFAPFYARHACWQEVGRKVAEYFFIVRENREYQFLTQDAKTRYASFRREFREIQKRLTQNDIAAYLGISPVSLSRLLSAKK